MYDLSRHHPAHGDRTIMLVVLWHQRHKQPPLTTSSDVQYYALYNVGTCSLVHLPVYESMCTLSAVLRSRWPSPQLTTKRAGFNLVVSPEPMKTPPRGSNIAAQREGDYTATFALWNVALWMEQRQYVHVHVHVFIIYSIYTCTCTCSSEQHGLRATCLAHCPALNTNVRIYIQGTVICTCIHVHNVHTYMLKIYIVKIYRLQQV